ncbi:MAG: nucleic acid-binding protein [delta proteobacterium ML8_F1]|nr:MAG: nucleic acid-binding protein [delta proteobacterium ML8_F1]
MKTKKIPLRKCIGCQTQHPKRELIRVVKDKEGNISVDFSGRANGRGAYICPRLDCFEKAHKRDAFSRALETKVPEEIYEALKKELLDGE